MWWTHSGSRPLKCPATHWGVQIRTRRTDSMCSFLISPLSCSSICSAPSVIHLNKCHRYLGFFFLSLSEYLPQVFWILSSCLNALRTRLSKHETTICRSSSHPHKHTCTSHRTSHVQRWPQRLVYFPSINFTVANNSDKDEPSWMKGEKAKGKLFLCRKRFLLLLVLHYRPWPSSSVASFKVST